LAEVVWTEQALEDLDAICRFIARDALSAAKLFAFKTFEASDALAEFPQMGRMVPELKDQSLRELILGQYRLIYRHDPTLHRVAILTLLHGARRFPSEI